MAGDRDVAQNWTVTFTLPLRPTLDHFLGKEILRVPSWKVHRLITQHRFRAHRPHAYTAGLRPLGRDLDLEPDALARLDRRWGERLCAKRDLTEGPSG